MNWFGWSLLSAFFAALTALLAKLGVEHLNSNLATAIRTSVAIVFAWIIAAITVQASDWTAISRKSLVFLALSGLGTGASWLCYFRAVQLGDISKVAPVDKLSVVFTAILALVVLGEKLGAREWTGLGLVVAGIALIAAKQAWVARALRARERPGQLGSASSPSRRGRNTHAANPRSLRIYATYPY